MHLLDVEAFLKGIKPAVYGNSNSHYFMQHLDQLKQYPYTTDKIDLFDGADFYLFFQTEQQKDDFLTVVNNLKPRSIAFHGLLGRTLGYPPRSVEFFIEKERLREVREQEGLKKLKQMSVTIYYCGCSPASHISDMIANVEWFWQRYNYEDTIQIGMLHEGIWKRDIHIPFLDTEALNQVYQMVRERLASGEKINV